MTALVIVVALISLGGLAQQPDFVEQSSQRAERAVDSLTGAPANWEQNVADRGMRAQVEFVNGNRYNARVERNQVSASFENVNPNWGNQPDLTVRSNYNGFSDFAWVDSNGFNSSNYNASIVLPDTYKFVYRCEGSQEDPSCTELDPRYLSGGEKPYYVERGDKTYVYMESFSGAGGSSTDVKKTNSYWTSGNNPDFNVRAIYSDLTKDQSSTTNVTVEAANDGFGTWTTEVSLYNFTNSSLSWSQSNPGTAGGAIEGLATGDIDGDGDTDLVWGEDDDNDVEWAENQGGSWTIHKIGNDDVESASLGDIDGDGDLDIVEGGGAGDLNWFENDGTDSGWTKHDLGTDSNEIRSVATGDLDGDGDLDVATTGQSSNVYWWENDGTDSSWTSNSMGTVDGNGWTITLGDIDGDGDLDAVTGSGGNDVNWFENDGTSNPSFSKDLIKNEDGGVFTLTLLDVDNDGDLDVASGDSASTADIHLNDNGDGSSWTSNQLTDFAEGDGVRALQAGDLDFDGDLDLVAGFDAGNSVSPHWVENDGTNSGWSDSAIGDAGDAGHYGVAIADFDQDGDLDIATGEDASTSNLRIWNTSGVSANKIGSDSLQFTNSAGNSKNATISWTPSKTDYNLMARVNLARNHTEIFESNDESAGNTNNMVVQTATAGVCKPSKNDWFINKNCTVVSALTFNGNVFVNSAKKLNISSEGSLDLDLQNQYMVIRESGSTKTQEVSNQESWNNGSSYNGTSADRSDNSGKLGLGYLNGSVGGAGSYQKETKDVNNYWTSGFNPDLNVESITSNLTKGESSWTNITANVSNDGFGTWKPNVSLYNYSSGSISWSDTSVVSEGGAIEGIVPADIDHDGDQDIVYSVDGNDDVVWAENNGEGGGWSTTKIGDQSAESVSVGDIDGDGDLDVVGVGNDFNIYFFENTNGDGSSWTRHQIGSFGTNQRSTALGDIDGDGDLDIVTTGQTNDVDWFENDGSNSGWSQSKINDLDNTGWSVAVADIDGDGDLDVVTGDKDNDVRWHENDGTSSPSFTNNLVDTTGYGQFSLGLADIDKDDDLDIISAGESANVYLHLNDNGDGSSWSTNTLADIGISEGIRSIQMGDIDFDGDLDIIAGYDAGNSLDPEYIENDGTLSSWPFSNIGDGGSSGGDAGHYGIAISDYDQDGDLDVMSGEDDNPANIRLWNSSGVTSNFLGSDTLSFTNAAGTSKEASIQWTPDKNSYNLTATVNMDHNFTEVLDTNDETAGETNNHIIQQISTVPPTSDLKGYWRLDKTSGSPPDYSGQGVDGTISGSPERGVGGVFSTNTYNFTQSTSDLVELQDDTGPLELTSKWTINAWVYPMTDDQDSYAMIFNNEDQSPYNGIKLGYKGNSPDTSIRCTIDTGSTEKVASASNPPVGQWSMLTCRYDGTDIELFVDTDSKDTVSSGSYNGGSDEPFTIGAAPPSRDTAYFTGRIDEVRVYNKSLSNTEINELYLWGTDGTFEGDYTSGKIEATGSKRWLNLRTDVNIPANTDVNATVKVYDKNDNELTSKFVDLADGVNDLILDTTGKYVKWNVSGISTDVTSTWTVNSFKAYRNGSSTISGGKVIVDQNATIK